MNEIKRMSIFQKRLKCTCTCTVCGSFTKTYSNNCCVASSVYCNMGWRPDPATSSIFATLTLNGVIFIALLVLFEIVRNQREVYGPRLRSKGHRTPAFPKRGLFSWATTVWSINDEETLKTCGADGYVFYRFLRMGFRTFGACAVIAIVTLFPIYGTAIGNAGVAGLAKYSMANLADSGDRLWASCIFTYIFTGIFLYFIHKEYEHFVFIRRQFLKSGDADVNEQKNFSVMVENVPISYRSSQKLFEFFEAIFPGEVLYACISVMTTPLTKAVANRKEAIVKLEKAIAAWKADDTGVRPEIKLKKGKPAMCGSTEKVDAIEYWTGKVKELDSEVTRLKQMAITAENAQKVCEDPTSDAPSVEDNKPAEEIRIRMGSLIPFNSIPQITKKDVSGTGFITFKSRKTQICACQLPVLSEEHPDVVVVPAPAPNDVVWANIGTKVAHTEYVSSITSVVYYMGLLFWGVVLAFIAAVSTLSNLEKFLPFVKQLDPVTYAIIAGQLPVIMVIVFIALLPIIMKSVSTFLEKRKSHSSISQEVFSW